MTSLNRRLVLEEARRTPDGAGGFATEWVALGALWGDVTAGPPRESEVPGGTLGVLPLRVTLRAAPPGAPSRPRPGQRLREGARLYRIDAVAEADARGRFLTCFAHEETAP